MLKNLIFDFDGTIVDSRRLTIKMLNQLSGKYGFRKIGEEEINYFRGLSTIERCKAINLPIYKLPMLIIDLKKNYNITDLIIYNGIIEVIKKLKEKKFIISIISSNSVENINSFLEFKDLKIFDRVYSAANFFRKETAIKNYISKYNLKREEIIYVGDEGRDIDACRHNKIKIISVAWGYETLDLLKSKKPDFIANDPSELSNIINQQVKLNFVRSPI